ncbi:MAG: PAS domain S-box protein, partial [Lentisphaerae bacterium]|nr:PAS domain S-box protein [Lentisphaerota bacterium]
MSLPPRTNIEVRYAVSSADDAETAGATATRQAMGEGLSEKLAAVLVFPSARYSMEKLFAGVRSVVGDVPILGGTTAGEICAGMVHHGSVVVVALASRYLSVSSAVGHNVSKNWRTAVNEALANPALTQHFGQETQAYRDELRRQGKSAFALVLSPGETPQTESTGHEIFSELRTRSEGHLPICGGCVSDGGTGKTSFVFSDGRSHSDSLLVAVFETQLTFGLGVCHSYTPELPRRTATRTRGQEILEIDGRPADAVFAEILGTNVDDLRGKDLWAATQAAVDVVASGADYTITLPRCLTESHGVRLARSIEEGSSISVMRVNPDNVAGTGAQAVLRALANGKITEPAMIFAFASSSREQMLGNQMSADVAGLSRWAEGVPSTGFLTAGEAGIWDDGINRFGDGLVSALVLGKELTPVAELWYENQRLLTEQTAAIEALSESDQRLRLLLENTSDGIVICERTAPDYRRTNVLFMNDRFVQMSGFTREELLATENWDHLSVKHHSFPDGVKVAEAFPRDEAQRGVSSWRRPDGKPNFREWTAVPLRIRGKTYSIGINRDVTERVQKEQRRDAMVVDLRTALNMADNLLACPDVDSCCREAVETVRTKLGLERCSIYLLQDGEMRGTYGTDTEGRTISEHDVKIHVSVDAWLVHHAQENSDGQRWKVLDQGEHVQWVEQTRHVVGKGWTVSTLVWPESAGHPLGVMYNDSAITHQPLDPMKQEVVAVFCSTLGSIIARKQQDEQIRFQATLLDQIQDVVTATDMEGRITFVNQANCELLGKRADDLVGTLVEHLGEDAKQGSTQKEILERTTAEGHWRGKVVNTDVNGNGVVLDCRTRVVRDSGGEPVGMIGVSTDITERDRQERATAALLRLLDYAGGHTVRQLLQRFLDEVEDITMSEIGFFHFLEPDEETVLLQMWSTNTVETMCEVEDRPRHCAVHQA